MYKYVIYVTTFLSLHQSRDTKRRDVLKKKEEEGILNYVIVFSFYLHMYYLRGTEICHRSPIMSLQKCMKYKSGIW